MSYISSLHPQISGFLSDLFFQEHLFNLLWSSSLYNMQNKELRSLTLAQRFSPRPLGHKAIWQLTIIQQRSVTYKLGL